MANLEIQEKDGKIFCPLKNDWFIAKPEEKVRQKYITILVNEYGYSLDQMAQELQVNNSSRGQGKARADIVIWKSKKDKEDGKSAFIVVECKAENVKVHVEDYYQGFNYASWAHAEFFVTTNEKETKYFNVDPTYLPQKLEEVVAIPTANDVDDAKKIEQIKNQTKTFTREEFTKTLRACHNIIRNNDKLSPEAAFDEISKLLFMKIRYERQNAGTKVFTKAEYLVEAENYEKNIRPGLKGTALYNQSYMQRLFSTTKVEFKEDNLFEESDEIKIRENSFVQILEKLENYNLSDTQDDVKGIAFEQFLGTTFRGELGQFFTPRTVVDFMTEILDPQEEEVICDPACGTGGFLVIAGHHVRENNEYELRTNTRAREHYQNRMFTGYDTDQTMLRITAMNTILHGMDNANVKFNDSLSKNNTDEDKYTVVLANPPFKGSLDHDSVAPSLISVTDTPKTELLFIALFLRMLDAGGRCGCIVPEGVLFGKTKAHRALRQELIEKNRLQAVISMPSGVFKPYSGVSTAVLIFTKTGTGGTDKVWFYDMQSDGRSLDDKRIESGNDGDIDDIIIRYKSLVTNPELEVARSRKDQSFLVPVQEIINNDYDLRFNLYKEHDQTQVHYDHPNVSIARFRELEEEIIDIMEELEAIFE